MIAAALTIGLAAIVIDKIVNHTEYTEGVDH